MLRYQNKMHWGWIQALSRENLMVLITQMLAVRVWAVLHDHQHVGNGLGLLGLFTLKADIRISSSGVGKTQQ